MDSEGSINKNGNVYSIHFGVKSKWIIQIYELFKSLGLRVSRRLKQDKNDYYYFYINVKDYISFGIGFTIKRKQEKLNLYKMKSKFDFLSAKTRIVLSDILQNPQTNITGIQKRKFISFPYLHKIIKQLENQGFVKTIKQNKSRIIELTERGKELIQEIEKLEFELKEPKKVQRKKETENPIEVFSKIDKIYKQLELTERVEKRGVKLWNV